MKNKMVVFLIMLAVLGVISNREEHARIPKTDVIIIDDLDVIDE